MKKWRRVVLLSGLSLLLTLGIPVEAMAEVTTSTIVNDGRNALLFLALCIIAFTISYRSKDNFNDYTMGVARKIKGYHFTLHKKSKRVNKKVK